MTRLSITPLAFLSLLGLFVACTNDDPSASTTTPDGGVPEGGTITPEGGSSTSDGGGNGTASLTWTKGTVTGPDAANIGGIAAIAFGGSKYVALAKATFPVVNKNAFALTSDDGKTWTQSAAFPLNYNIVSLVYTGTGFAASGSAPSEDGAKAVLATTTDGITWAFENLPGDAGSARTVASVGTSLHFAGAKGAMNVKAGAAAATAYTTAFVGSNAFTSCVIGTRVISAGQADASKSTDPLFTYSDDVTTAAGWKAGIEPSDVAREANRFYGLACDAERQIAVGAGTVVWVSTDKGQTWIVGNPDGDSTTWQKIEKANGKYVIVGWRGAYGVTTTGTDLAVGTIAGSDRDFESAATDGTIVVTGTGGLYNDQMAGEFYWTAP